MKKVFCLLIITLFSLSIAAQNDTIFKTKKAIISLDALNVVYRGISNPLTITVPNSKSFIASGLGLTKMSEGKYRLNPGSGKEVIITLNIILNDNSEIIEEHKFRIKTIQPLMAFLNGSNCSNCIVEMTKQELKRAEISIKMEDIPIEMNFNIESFKVKFASKKAIQVAGNKFNQEILNEVKKLKTGSIFYVQNIKMSNPNNFCFPGIKPIKVMIIDSVLDNN